MSLVVRIIGVVFVGLGIIMVINPQVIKGLLAFYKQGRKLYLLGALRLLMGIIFLLGASQCRRVIAVIILGILFILGGVLIFAVRLEKMKSILSWWEKRPLFVLRLTGLLILGLGGLVVYCA